jgi:carbon-monoxide dehydrogenase small subunit
MSAAPRTIRFTLNGAAAECVVAPHETLVDVLRDRFALGGPRESCGQGLCGCCTVLVDSAAVSGCLYLAVFADGAELVTVEGLAMATRCTRCRKPSSRRVHSSAAFARPDSC